MVSPLGMFGGGLSVGRVEEEPALPSKDVSNVMKTKENAWR